MRRALVLLAYGRFGTRRATLQSSQEIQRILLVRPDHLGDLLFATPALKRIRQAFPGAHITGLVGPWGRAMWEGNPDLNSLETLPFPGIAGVPSGGATGPYRLLGDTARKLEHKRYDLGIVFRFDHWWGAALLWAAGISHRWGYDTPGANMASWLTDAVPYIPGRHEVEQDLYLAEAAIQKLAPHSRLQRLGPLDIDRAKGEPPLRPPDPTPMQDLPTDWQTATRRAIIHPGTGAANKLWTISGWAQVADRLSSEGWAVALTGAPSERVLTETIVSALSSKPLNLAGQTASLSQLTSVLDQAHMVLGVDSGPLHIAAALHKPTLHLYGPSDEAIWGPWGDPRRHRAFRAPGTRPTGRLDVASRELEGGPEMRAITVEMVMGEINKLIGSE